MVHALIVHVFDRTGWVFRYGDGAARACPLGLVSWVCGVHTRQRSVFAVSCAAAAAVAVAGKAGGGGGDDDDDDYSEEGGIGQYSPLAFELE